LIVKETFKRSPMPYQIRRYRNWVEDKTLVSFSVKIGESDLFIRAEKPFNQPAQKSLRTHRQLIEGYLKKDPGFAGSLEPYSVCEDAPEIIRGMSAASFSAGVGPMAAVAGAVAEYVGKDLLKFSPELIVENGGDIFIATKRIKKIGIFAGNSPYTEKLALEIPAGTWGVCTSSGTVGPSLSFGQADAAVVVCNSAILADAWATRLGNMIKTANDIERTLEFVKDKPKIKGVVLILGEKIGVWGNLKLVKT